MTQPPAQWGRILGVGGGLQLLWGALAFLSPLEAGGPSRLPWPRVTHMPSAKMISAGRGVFRPRPLLHLPVRGPLALLKSETRPRGRPAFAELKCSRKSLGLTRKDPEIL